ncbi:AAA family ATPase [Nocardia sp. NPDC049149]|uniref:AAA family ATPase n=1 Tax=Nocardia sp. NPDC049149 TaxID=3364315 RepID=UPI003720AE6C
MIVWLNGTFGAGKTTTARELVGLLPEARIFDAEYVGYMLRHVMVSEQVGDFQEWRPWRGLVVATATQVLDYVGGTLVIPQSVLVQQYWQEISAGLAAADVPVHHVVLDAERAELLRRIESDTAEPGARQWRLDHLDAYETARSWLGHAGEVIDTAGLDPSAVAARIAADVQARVRSWQ